MIYWRAIQTKLSQGKNTKWHSNVAISSLSYVDKVLKVAIICKNEWAAVWNCRALVPAVRAKLLKKKSICIPANEFKMSCFVCQLLSVPDGCICIDSQSQLSLSHFRIFSFHICTFSSNLWFRWLSGLWADIFDAVAAEALLKIRATSPDW